MKNTKFEYRLLKLGFRFFKAYFKNTALIITFILYPIFSFILTPTETVSGGIFLFIFLFGTTYLSNKIYYKFIKKDKDYVKKQIKYCELAIRELDDDIAKLES